MFLNIPSAFRILCACFIAALPVSLKAQDANGQASFRLELNAAADTTGGSCRLTYVATNQSDISLDTAAYEVAIFDAEGVVNRLIVLDLGKLVEGKTKILQFDLGGTPCAQVSRIVVNAGASCIQSSDGQEIGLCMDALSTGSRTAIQFGI